MHREMVAKELLAVASLIAGGTSSLDGLRKQKAKDFVNSLMSKHTKGMFTDEYWTPIMKTFKELDNAGVSYELKKAEYTQDAKGNPNAKRWSIEIPFMNEKGREAVLYGTIVASGAGSVSSPLDRYDVVPYCG